MNLMHHTESWQWRLPAGRVQTLAASNVGRWLVVTEGRAWLTRTGAGPEGDDVWLDAGERQWLPVGSEWVVEAWPSARFVLAESPPPSISAS